MQAQWLIVEDYLALKSEDGTIIVPSAIDIFQAQFRGKHEILNQEVNPPSESFPWLTICKYPLKVSIVIQSADGSSSSLLNMVLQGTQAETKLFITKPLSRVTDHLISNNTWYAIEKGSLSEIKEMMTKFQISDDCKLNLQQMLKILTNPAETIPVFLEADLHKVPGIANCEKIPLCYQGRLYPLYPYQVDGFRWLAMICNEGLGCLLGDEMGLGKTVQIICLIARNIEKGKKPSLIVAPATLLENWRQEFKKFTPSISTYVHIGDERTGFPSDLQKYDVIITSYSTLIRDTSLFSLIPWDVLVADEAQSIKNPLAERTEVIKSIQRSTSIAVTGTPVQNSLTDLWSIMDFAIPGLLGDKTSFEARYVNSVESAIDIEPIVTPVILRRTIAQVAKQLPPKITIPQPLEMPFEMAREYETVRQETLNEYGTAAQLVNLQKLRMFCTHPFLLHRNNIDPSVGNPKYQRLLEILEEIFANDEQALIFTSFKDMIDILLIDLPKRFSGVSIGWIDGRVPICDRQPKVDEFNSSKKPSVLILNPNAAGTGLNLTGANHVIHYNLEWNPAVEDQASGRAHRIGQKKPVTIHRLFYVESVEEVINDRLHFKRDLANNSVKGVNGAEVEYSDIMRALQVSPKKAEWNS